MELMILLFMTSKAFAQSDTNALTIPIADVHMHVSDGNTGPEQLERMKSSGILYGGGVGDWDKTLFEQLKGRYISPWGQREWTRAFIRSGGNAALSEIALFEDFLVDAERRFKTGQIKGFGELHTNSLGKYPRNTPIDGPVLQRLYELAGRYGGFVQLHHSARRAPVEPVIAMAKKYPDTKFIYAHCMFDRTGEVIRKIFSATTNTYCELSSLGIVHGERIAFDEGGLKSAYKQLIEQFPDRVMLGTDPCCGKLPEYAAMISFLRTKVLLNLSEPARVKVAYQNAVRVFDLRP